MALVTLNFEPLEVRREKLCKTFAKKKFKTKHSEMFMEKNNPHKPKYFVPKSNTKKFFNSPQNYLTRLLNSE